jgi:predicted aldo/keto reductase-like oxidoreductase
MNTINYKYISDAVDHYVNNGYNYIEVPWYVTEDVMNVTKTTTYHF